MGKRILIIGGAGFIGSHLADELLEHGHCVRVLDNLDPQVHGDDAIRPSYLHNDVELQVGDVRDCFAVERALQHCDVVFHFAAAVGVGQSMYEISRYSSINCLGTAVLLEAITRHPIDRLIIASSMSIYGEGAYNDVDGESVNVRRDIARVANRQWEIIDDKGRPINAVATSETKTPDPSSVYALLKYNQEQTCLCVGQAYRIPTVSLRFFNAFGPRQALSNPYTGVMAIFAARLLNNQSPMVYEDGRQLRDFVSVHDVVRACRLAMECDDAIGEVFNIGSGTSRMISTLAGLMANVLNRPHIRPQITEKYRVGDVRHCYADIRRAERLFGYRPQVDIEAGLSELVEWLSGQVARDRVAQAGSELTDRGLAL
jgi:dTDP-L-rhamnose 4-epimerase